MKFFNSTCKASFFIAVFGGLFQTSSNAQMPYSGGMQRGGRQKIAQAIHVPFPFLDRTIKFHAAQLGNLNFIQMGSLFATLPSGFEAVSHPQPIIQLEYGYRRNGVVRIYETPKIPKKNAKDFIQAVVEGRVFRDTNGQPGYEFAVVPNKRLFIGVGSSDHLAFVQSVKELSLAN